MNQTVLELREPPWQARAANTRVQIQHAFGLGSEKGRNDALKTEVNELLWKAVRFEGLLRMSSAIKMTNAEEKTLGSHWQRFVGHLHTLILKILRFQARVAENVEYAFTEFGRHLKASTSNHVVARWISRTDAIKESIAPV